MPSSSTRPGGTVSVTSSVAADGEVMLRIIDTGIGIAAGDIPKALAAFGQVDSSLSRKYEGRGWACRSPRRWSSCMAAR